MRTLALVVLIIVGGGLAGQAGVLGAYVAACVVASLSIQAVVLTHRWRRHQMDHRQKTLELELLEMHVRRTRDAPPRVTLSPDGRSWWDGERWRPFGFWSDAEAPGTPPRPARLVERALSRMPRWW